MTRRRVIERPRAWLRAAGYDVARYPPPPRPADLRRLEAIRAKGVGLVLDVGANDGAFGERLRQSGYAGRILSFEPLDEVFDILQRKAAADPAWDAIRTAVGDRNGTADLNVSGMTVSSSLLPMEALHVDVAPQSTYRGRQTVPIRTLDALLNERPGGMPATPCYLKIDAQGYEGKVLDGAVATLRRAPVLELEISTRSLYEGSPLFPEMLARVTSLGYTLVSWEDVFVDDRTGFVLAADCIFVL
jgi:FkbM family methyltransferase